LARGRRAFLHFGARSTSTEMNISHWLRIRPRLRTRPSPTHRHHPRQSGGALLLVDPAELPTCQTSCCSFPLFYKPCLSDEARAYGRWPAGHALLGCCTQWTHAGSLTSPLDV